MNTWKNALLEDLGYLTEAKIPADVDDILDFLSCIFYSLYSKKYGVFLEKEIIRGGGGTSPICPIWINLSKYFIKHRISSEAEKVLLRNNIDLKTLSIRNPIFSSNQKSVEKRKKHGQLLHRDHNPSNSYVLRKIRDEVRSYNNLTVEEGISKLKEFIKDIQTIDIITIEQDEIRNKHNDISAKERDGLINDTFKIVEGIIYN